MVLTLIMLSFSYAQPEEPGLRPPVEHYYKYRLGTRDVTAAAVAQAEGNQALTLTFQAMLKEHVYLTKEQHEGVQKFLQRNEVAYTPTEYRTVNGRLEERRSIIEYKVVTETTSEGTEIKRVVEERKGFQNFLVENGVLDEWIKPTDVTQEQIQQNIKSSISDIELSSRASPTKIIGCG